MTITTIDAIVADVMLMAELDWLLGFDPLARVPSGSSNFCRDPEGREQNKDGAVNRGSRQIVRAVTEYLWHCRLKTVILVWKTDLSAYRRELAEQPRL